MHITAPVRPERSRRSRRRLATVAAIAPLTLVAGVIAAGSASAAGPGADCLASHWNVTFPTVSADGTATVTDVPAACQGADLTLVAYTAHGPDFASAGLQTLLAAQTKKVNGPTTFTVTAPGCYYQLDLITGTDVPKTIEANSPYFSSHDTLLAHLNGGTKACVAARTTAAPPPQRVVVAPVRVTRPAPPAPSTPSAPVGGTTVPIGLDVNNAQKIPATQPGTTTAVLGETFSKGSATNSGATVTTAPATATLPVAASLPFTGLPVPLGQVLALAGELLAAGVLLLTAARRRRAG